MYQNPEQAFGSASKLLSLVEQIYSAADQPDLWPVVLDTIAATAHGESIALFARFPKDTLIALARFGSGSFEEYADYYSSVNPLSIRCDAMFRDGEVRYSHLTMQNTELENTEFYADFFRRWDMHYSFGIKVPLGDQPAAYISCQRPKNKGPFEKSEGLIYETLLPHLQRSLRLHHRLSMADARSRGLQNALESFGHAILGVDHLRKVVFASRQAEDLARAGDGLKIVGGRLVAELSDENTKLQAALNSAIGLTSSPISLSVSRKTAPVLHVAVAPFRSVSSSRDNRVAALVFIAESNTATLSRSSVLRDLFQLTPTELRIADSLIDGSEISAISAQLGLTLDTTRFYVKRILAKTGTNRQTDLVRLVISLPSV